MTPVRLAPLLLSVALLAACGSNAPPATPASTAGASPDAAPPEAETRDDSTWIAPLDTAIAGIDDATPGAMGVWMRRVGGDDALDHAADRPWYLASTIKVPVAIAVLQAAEAGELSLDEEIELQQSDFVDGAGDLVWQKPGARYSIATLLEKSIVNSDSVATDMLIRRLGEDALNARVAEWTDGFGPITTILQVRYDAYGELHPGVAKLSNMDLIALKNAEAGDARLAALRTTLGVTQDDLDADSIEAAFERYYEGDRNTATLAAFGTVLDRLAAGELLSPEHTTLLLGHMQKITTGAKRIQAQLPPGTAFAQKTGTQIARACNVGILEPGDEDATVVVACLEKFDELAQAESALQSLGKAIGESGVLD